MIALKKVSYNWSLKLWPLKRPAPPNHMIKIQVPGPRAATYNCQGTSAPPTHLSSPIYGLLAALLSCTPWQQWQGWGWNRSSWQQNYLYKMQAGTCPFTCALDLVTASVLCLIPANQTHTYTYISMIRPHLNMPHFFCLLPWGWYSLQLLVPIMTVSPKALAGSKVAACTHAAGVMLQAHISLSQAWHWAWP